MTRPIGIDLFAGAGGMSLGFEQAGFDIAAAVELDPVHAATHKFNFPNCQTIAHSVTDLTGDQIRHKAGLGRRRIEVVFGGAPCQGFSLIGQRAFDDPRNALVRDFIRLVDELKPEYFVFENVKGLTVGKHKVFLDALITEFDTVGYRVRTPWRVLNAYSFGVPQDRQRLFLIGARKARSMPDYPEPLTSPAGRTNGGLPSGPSCYDALNDLPEVEKYGELLGMDSVQVPRWRQPSKYAQQLRCLSNDAWAFGYPREWQTSLLTASSRTQHTDISTRNFSETKPGTVEPISRFFRLPKNGVSNTLRAGTDSARGAFTSPRPIHYASPRCITVREMARLHGFPDWFRFHVTKWHGARQVGNAVPPPLAKAVAETIIAAAKLSPEHPSQVLQLGDKALLSMGMKEASDYFGIKVPIGKRDRKSGAKKRKQTDIEANRMREQVSTSAMSS